LKEYLLPEEIDNWDKAVISLCLGFKTPAHLEGYDEYMIRFIPARDEAGCSISIQTEVPAGGDVWMTRRDPSKMEVGVNRVARELPALPGGEPPLFVLQFDCCGRGRVILPESAKLGMLRELQRSVGPEAPWLGLYTLGEIGPIGRHNCFHNYTVVLAAIYSRAAGG
jgi:small ligand-binding sensory domain FIST